ncbi:integrase [Mycolicibacterium llatzerense]|nr:integrase [Mycolicibacterium llatzerense]MCT7370524.1 integrase [Mycolicibacterium llatzerense]
MRQADTGRVVKPSARTVSQFLDEWFSAVEATFDGTTWQNWKDYARVYVIPRIGEEKLQRLDEPQLLKLYAALRTDGRIKLDHNSEMFAYWTASVARGCAATPRQISEACGTTIHAARKAVRRYQSGITPIPQPTGLAPKTVRNIHAMIHRALSDAVAWKYMAYNPASNIKPPKKPRALRTVWNPDQIRMFLRSIRHDRFSALFLLELTTGVRRGQICGLRWSEVDLVAGEITVHNNRVVIDGHAKDKAGGKTRNADKTISLDRATLSALQSWREHQDKEREFYGADYHPGGYVFTFEDGRPPHPDTIRQRFDRLAAAAGLSRITFHDLRHSYATGALKAGVNPKVISERIGHADVGFFLQTYAHVIKNDDREAAEQAAAFLIGDDWPV